MIKLHFCPLQKVTLKNCCYNLVLVTLLFWLVIDCTIDLVLIADNSGSVTKVNNELQNLRNFLKNIVAKFNVGTANTETQIGVVKFASTYVAVTLIHYSLYILNGLTIYAVMITRLQERGMGGNIF
jgi:hypothetical protein